MSRSIKKRVSSMSFSINRVYRAISTAKPSNLIIPIAAIAFAVFLFGGGLYALIMKPLPAVYYGGRFLFVYPQLSEQFIGDTIVSIAVYSFGVAGLLVIYQSTRYIYKPRQAYMMLIVGIALMLLSYLFLEATIRQKLGG